MAKKTVAIVLDENDVLIVQEVQAMYDASFSEAVRQIIRDYSRTMPTSKTITIGGVSQSEK